MGCSQGTSTMKPHRPQTTEGTTESRSITYTMGCAQRRGTTSVSRSDTPMLTGYAMMIAISDETTVPYTNDIAPNLLWAGSQSIEKTPDQPSALNHWVDSLDMVTAIRTRITSTSSPDASASIWKARSPSGLRGDSPEADPAGVAGSACTVALMRTGPSGLPVSWRSSFLAGDLAQLGRGLREEA